MDENVCLLGDAEREITDADKERAVVPTEDEEPADEHSAASKDASEPIEIEDNDVEEMPVDSTEKDTEEPDQEIEQTEDHTDSAPLKENEIREISDEATVQTCLNCENLTKCFYRLLEESDTKYLCSFNCVTEHREDNPDKYTLIQKKVFINLVPESVQTCDKCKTSKSCRYRLRSSKDQQEPEKTVVAEPQTAAVEAEETAGVEKTPEPVEKAPSTEESSEKPMEETLSDEKPAEETTEKPTTEEKEAEPSEKPIEEEQPTVEAAAVPEKPADAEPKPVETETSSALSEWTYLCNDECLNGFIDNNVEKYVVKKKKFLIDEIPVEETQFECVECSETKSPRYKFLRHDEDNSTHYICTEVCLNLILKEQPETFRVRRRSTRMREQPKRVQPEESEVPKIVARTDAEVDAARVERDASFIRRCGQCFDVVKFNAKSIQWETLDFCDEKCLGQYQNLIGAACTTCNNPVTMASLGKYCVRFGFDVKQFCCSGCLDVYKKALKQCTLCQRDLTGEENVVLAKVGEKGQFKDFCNQICLRRFEEIINPNKKKSNCLCSVCNNQKPARVEVCLEGGVHKFCSNPCFSAFKFVNNVFPDQCEMCLKFFERKSNDAHTIYNEDASKMFCSKICMNIFICKTREIWQCNWCKVSKYNYDMIVRNYGKTKMCSLNCLTLFEVSVNALSRKR